MFDWSRKLLVPLIVAISPVSRAVAAPGSEKNVCEAALASVSPTTGELVMQMLIRQFDTFNSKLDVLANRIAEIEKKNAVDDARAFDKAKRDDEESKRLDVVLDELREAVAELKDDVGALKRLYGDLALKQNELVALRQSDEMKAKAVEEEIAEIKRELIARTAKSSTLKLTRAQLDELKRELKAVPAPAVDSIFDKFVLGAPKAICELVAGHYKVLQFLCPLIAEGKQPTQTPAR